MKRKEKEYELEMQRLAKEKITLQERIQSLKSELARMNIEVDLNQWITLPDEQDTNSTSTATGRPKAKQYFHNYHLFLFSNFRLKILFF